MTEHPSSSYDLVLSDHSAIRPEWFLTLFTVKEAAAMLRMTGDLVLDEIRRGRLKCYRRSRKVILISLIQIRAYLESIEIPRTAALLTNPVDNPPDKSVRSPREGGEQSRGPKRKGQGTTGTKSSRVVRAQLRKELREC